MIFMEVINRSNPKIILNGGRSVTRMYATVEKRRIYFTSMITRVCEMKEGLYVHFLNEGDVWQFYINDDTDGFKLTPVRSKNGFHVSNSGLVNMILNSTGHQPFKKFEVKKTQNIHDKCPVFSLTP